MQIKLMVLAGIVATAVAPAFSQTDDQIHVRVINALPQSEGLSLTIGEAALFTGIKSNEVTPFKPLPKQDDNQKITIQNGKQQLQTAEALSFDDEDENYTVLVTQDPDNPNPKVKVLKDDRDDVDQDEVELTVINAAPEHKSVKVRLNDDVEDRGINYAESSDNDVKPGVYNLAIINASGSDSVIAQRSITLTGGTAVTVLLTSPNNVKIINNSSPQAELAGGGNAQAADRQSTATAANSSPVGAASTQAPSTMTTPATSF